MSDFVRFGIRICTEGIHWNRGVISSGHMSWPVPYIT